LGKDSENWRTLNSNLPVGKGLVTLEAVANLKDLLPRVTADQFDIIFLDSLVVGVDVELVVDRIHLWAPQLPVILLAPEVDESQVLRLINSGLTDVVSCSDLTVAYLGRALARTQQKNTCKNQLSTGLSDFLIRSNLDGVVFLDENGCIREWNSVMEQMFGVAKTDVLRRIFSEVIPYFAESGQPDLIADALNNRPALGREQCCYVPLTGKTLYYRAFYSPIANRRGEVSGVVVIVRDFTERKRSQSLLQAAEMRIATLADVNPSLVWLSGPDGERAFFNQRWLTFTGSTIEKQRGDGWLQSVFPTHVARVKSALSNAKKGQSNYHLEYHFKGTDGRYHTMLETGAAQFTPDGTFAGFVGWCTDLGETRLTQHNLGAVSLRPEPSSTHDNSPIGIWKLDEKLAVLKANSAVGAQLGLPVETIIGTRFLEIVPAVSGKALMEVIHTGNPLRIKNQQIIVHGPGEDRESFWDLDAWTITDAAGCVIGVGVSTIEVTERKKVEQQREDFVATLVHDLKTPLIGADRALQAMLNGAVGSVDHQQSHILGLLRNSNKDLLAMIQNVIEVYRFESGNAKFTFESVSLTELALKTIEELAFLANEKGLILNHNLSILGRVSADRAAICRLFQNLLGNAIKFTPRGGTITVSAEQDSGGVSIFFRDSGVGIPEQEQKHLFKRFSQGESGKRYATGSGLGLYLCKQIVDAHRGTLDVVSTKNIGTTFSVGFPTISHQLSGVRIEIAHPL